MAGLARTFIEVDSEEGYPCTGVTLQWTNLSMIEVANRASELKAFIEALQPCVTFYLRRRDILAQAISHFIMMKSGYYHSTDFEGRRRQRVNVCYDRAEIASYLDFTQRSYNSWDALLAESNITPIPLYYEYFVADPLVNFKDLAKCISGRSYSNDTIAAAASCQSKVSDSIDEAFRARYLAE
jgi:LPS sulfotransferase NodH